MTMGKVATSPNTPCQLVKFIVPFDEPEHFTLSSLVVADLPSSESLPPLRTKGTVL